MAFWNKDEPPNREEAIELLRACSGNPEKIKQWNDLCDRFEDWQPDLTDGDLTDANLASANLS